MRLEFEIGHGAPTFAYGDCRAYVSRRDRTFGLVCIAKGQDDFLLLCDAFVKIVQKAVVFTLANHVCFTGLFYRDGFPGMWVLCRWDSYDYLGLFELLHHCVGDQRRAWEVLMGGGDVGEVVSDDYFVPVLEEIKRRLREDRDLIEKSAEEIIRIGKRLGVDITKYEHDPTLNDSKDRLKRADLLASKFIVYVCSRKPSLCNASISGVSREEAFRNAEKYAREWRKFLEGSVMQ